MRRRLVSDGFMSALEPYLQDMFNKADQGHETDCAGNGVVTFDEIVENVDGVDGSHIDHIIFSAVDGNDDGKVTYDEFKQFVQTLLKYQLGDDATTDTHSPEAIANAIQMLLLSG